MRLRLVTQAVTTVLLIVVAGLVILFVAYGLPAIREQNRQKQAAIEMSHNACLNRKLYSGDLTLFFEAFHVGSPLVAFLQDQGALKGLEFRGFSDRTLNAYRAGTRGRC